MQFSLALRSRRERTGWMNRLRPLLLGALLFAAASSALAQKSHDWLASYNGLLRKYVTSSGVKYAEWKGNTADVQALQTVVDAIAQENVASLGKQEQLAFYMNAYNAWILHEALGKYPTRSVKDTLFTFFTGKRIKVTGEEMSFKHLENDVIRAKFGEPRVHFALNCASRSCPPLNQEAFRADSLDAQFEKLAKAFVNSEKGVVFSADKKTAELSQIFDWYKDDFKEGGPLAFINKRRSTPVPSDAKISYQKYDWSLNETK
ncbi:MAG: DUF547 domain-containing protein [Chthoniobacterales bacterium]